MALPVTTPFWPIYVRKSDGHEVFTSKGIQVKNAPSIQQLDRTPNSQGQSDYYRLIERDEPKHIDWRKKLGGMLLRELGGKQTEDKWAQTILYDLPEGYQLFEHIKSKADGQTRPVKNHSGGGHDRQDAYLYGYPKGPKKRFRSPVEFFPHLLWLSTDESNDYENCTCKMCSPLQLESEKPTPKPEPMVPLKKEPSPATATPPSGMFNRQPAVQIPIRRPSIGPPSAQSPKPSTPTPNAYVPRPVPAAPIPTPLPQPRSIDQQIDGQYNRFLARIGELVWFHRPKNRAWGLGVVVRRWHINNPSVDGSSKSVAAYRVQPLSHPFESPSQEDIISDGEIKPWLAWSAPQCTYSYLQQNPALHYDQVDWQALLRGNFGSSDSGNAEVDASILAAKAIDTTYTLCERLKTTHNTGYEERHWNCMYLGAERIWNGEPVRLRIGSGTDIVVITDIIERIIPNSAPFHNGHPSSSSVSQINVIGDVYTYATVQVSNIKAPPPLPQNNGIPLRMQKDMAWRNRDLLEQTHTLAYWRLVQAQSRIDVSEIKGRWYETSIVFVDAFKTAIIKKEGGNGVWMNSRGDAIGAGKMHMFRKDDRVDAFGDAVPKNTVLHEGLEPPSHDHVRQTTNDMQGLGLSAPVSGVGDGDFLADFMNLDGMAEEEGMGFNHHFGFQ
ncbi:transcription-silencing protein Clr2-domain-containing protein [Dendryphion nanum]|uniref:Transcription-silencing protein Clr2-domain-containing protein n=1 Tax=Dendryphion nanum TaxID=256645 RepID=A0A9P9E475_9PLEO|nr:transcription-silencing protein Clr2-domain-containing protein [Dendryphion nanum]